MVGCVDHGCYLEPDDELWLVRIGNPPSPRPLAEPLATLDRYTYSALTTGMVALPGRTMQAAVWFRLLRCLLDELSLVVGGSKATGRACVETIRAAAGIDERAGISVWRPYELFDWPTQEKLLTGAAHALRLAADSKITALGTWGSALATPPYRPVFDGDPPDPDVAEIRRLRAEFQAWFEVARTDRGRAREVTIMYTRRCRNLLEFGRERDWLLGQGIPAEFVPGARELGRADLLGDPTAEPPSLFPLMGLAAARQ